MRRRIYDLDDTPVPVDEFISGRETDHRQSLEFEANLWEQQRLKEAKGHLAKLPPLKTHRARYKRF